MPDSNGNASSFSGFAFPNFQSSTPPKCPTLQQIQFDHAFSKQSPPRPPPISPIRVYPWSPRSLHLIRVHSWSKTPPSPAPHSCPFMVQNTPSPAPIRVHSWSKTPPSPAPHSCPFVVQNALFTRTSFVSIRGSKTPPSPAPHSCPFVVPKHPLNRTSFVSIRGSKRPLHPHLIRVHSWFKTPPHPHLIRVHSWFITPPQPHPHSCPFVSIRGS